MAAKLDSVIFSAHRNVLPPQFSFDPTDFGGGGGVKSVTVVFHLFFHYNTRKVHRGAFVVSVDEVKTVKEEMSECNFCALPEGLTKVRTTTIRVKSCLVDINKLVKSMNVTS